MCIYVICDRVYIYIIVVYIYIYIIIIVIIIIIIILTIIVYDCRSSISSGVIHHYHHFWGYEPISPVGIYTMSSYTYRWFGRICDYNIL